MKPIYTLLIGIVVGALLLWMLMPEPKHDDTRERTIQSKYEADTTLLRARNRAMVNVMKKDSVEGVRVQDSLKTRAIAYRQEVVRLKENPIVIKVREDVPEVDSLILAQDSVIAIQENRIAAHEHQLGKLQVSMVGITANFESQLAAERRRFEAQQQISNEYRKEVRKERRQKRLAIGIGIAATAVALLIK